MQGRVYLDYLEKCWHAAQLSSSNDSAKQNTPTPKIEILLESNALKTRPFDANERNKIYASELQRAADSEAPHDTTPPFLAQWHSHVNQVRNFERDEIYLTLPLKMSRQQLQTLLMQFEVLLRSITYPLAKELTCALKENNPTMSTPAIQEKIYPFIRGYVFNILNATTRWQQNAESMLLQGFHRLVRNTIFPLKISSELCTQPEELFLNQVREKFDTSPHVTAFQQCQKIVGVLAEECLIDVLKKRAIEKRPLLAEQLSSLHTEFLPVFTDETLHAEMVLLLNAATSQDNSLNGSPRSVSSDNSSSPRRHSLLAKVRSSFHAKLSDALGSSASSPAISPMGSPASAASTPPDSPIAAVSLSAPSLASPHSSSPSSPSSARRVSFLFTDRDSNDSKHSRSNSASLQQKGPHL